MTVPITRPFYRPAAAAGLGKARPFIPVPPKRSIEFRFQEFLDEAANTGPHPGFQGIEPIVPKKKRSFSRFRCSFYGIRFHGVISIGAPTPIRFEQTNWRLRHLQIPTTPATAPPPSSEDTNTLTGAKFGLRHEQSNLLGKQAVYPFRVTEAYKNYPAPRHWPARLIQ
jgi:hypothetical protein